MIVNDSNNVFFEEQVNYYCCDLPHIHSDNGYNVCINCGHAFSKILDLSPRRMYDKKDINERKINEPVFFNIGYRTTVKGKRDAKGNALPSNVVKKFERLSKIQRSFTDPFEYNFWYIFPIFKILRENLSISHKIAREGLDIYKKSIMKKLAIGRSRIYLITASLFCAARINKTNHFLEEFIDALELNKKKFIRNCWLINKEVLPDLGYKLEHYTPEKYIDRFQSDLNLSVKCGAIAKDIIKKARKKGFVASGKEPKGVAAGALYIASKLCNERRTIKQLCEVTKKNHITITRRVRELKTYAAIIF
ncbi:MAG: hypothetical protein ACFFBP_03950 [Promethearchaeota archaeon]